MDQQREVWLDTGRDNVTTSSYWQRFAKDLIFATLVTGTLKLGTDIFMNSAEYFSIMLEAPILELVGSLGWGLGVSILPCALTSFAKNGHRTWAIVLSAICAFALIGQTFFRTETAPAGQQVNAAQVDQSSNAPPVAPVPLVTESSPPAPNRTSASNADPLPLPKDFIECSNDNGMSLCEFSTDIIQLQRQLVQQSGSATFEFAGQRFPYRIQWHTTEAVDGRVPYTIFLDAKWRGLEVKEIFTGYETSSLSLNASLNEVKQQVKAVGGRPMQDGEMGCGIYVFRADGHTVFSSGC